LARRIEAGSVCIKSPASTLTNKLLPRLLNLFYRSGWRRRLLG
jgi:hypothetical protein